jgi:iron complex transport system substrate-binding protein
MNRRFRLFLLLILFASPGLFSGACGGKNAPAPEKSFTITDHAGRAVGFSKIPDKIISLSPGTTEIIFALGLNDKLLGVTSFCDYPAEAQRIDQVGGYSTVDKEKVVDKIGGDRDGAVIFASTIHIKPGGVLSDLERLGYKTVVLEANTIERLFDCMKLVNEICGGGSAAGAVIQSLEARVHAVKSRINASVPRVTVMHEVFGGHWIAGADTLENDIITAAGGINIAASTGAGYGQINIESIIDANPDKIVVVSQMGTMVDGLVSSEITDNPVFRVLDAVKNRRVYVIDADIVSRSGPRAVGGLEEYAKILHPEIFGDSAFPH